MTISCDFAGEADAATLPGHYHSADVFVLATLYEGYGMAVAEALARGLPVVSTRTGAIAELVGDEAGLVVPPGDVTALSHALSQVLGDAAADGVRERLAAGARRVRERLPTWDDAAGRMDARAQPRGRLMGEFTADWLALREPADARARSAKLTALVAERLRHDAPLRVLDLAAGTGPTPAISPKSLPPADMVNGGCSLTTIGRCCAIAARRSHAWPAVTRRDARSGSRDGVRANEPPKSARAGISSRHPRSSTSSPSPGCTRWQSSAARPARPCCWRSPTTATYAARPKSRKTMRFASW